MRYRQEDLIEVLREFNYEGLAMAEEILDRREDISNLESEVSRLEDDLQNEKANSRDLKRNKVRLGEESSYYLHNLWETILEDQLLCF